MQKRMEGDIEAHEEETCGYIEQAETDWGLV